MKIKYILFMLLIIGCATQAIEADEIGYALGTINPGEEMRVDIPSTSFVNLQLFSSEYNESLLSYGVISHSNNNTTYDFVCGDVLQAPYDFEPGIKNYYFYDSLGESVYVISVNLSSVTVPENPYIKEIEELKQINETKTNEIKQLEENVSTLKNETIYLESDLSNATTRLATIEGEYVGELNETKTKLESAQQEVVNLSGQLSNLQQNYATLEEERDRLQDELEGWPYIATVIVLVMSLIIFVFVHMLLKKRFQKKSDITIENDTNYTPLTRKFDAFAKKFFRKEADKTKRGKTLDLQHINQQVEQAEPIEPQQPMQQEEENVQNRQPLKIGKKQETPRDEKEQTVIQHDNTQKIVDGFKNELFSKIDELNDRVDKAESRQRGDN